jgi:ubiquinone/menaquinone biosynthesis C-methylase UbiE
MRISRLEKIFVNNRRIAEKNIIIVERLFTQIDLGNVKRVLEVGCGIGVVASHLSEKYQWDVTGVDLDPEQIKIAKIDHPENENLKFFEADTKELPFEDREFDLVLSFDVLHHIPDWDKALREINRVLGSKGLYILNDLSLPKFTTKIYKNCGVFSADDVINHLRENGLVIIYTEKPKVNVFARIGRHFNIISQAGVA